MSLNSSPPQKAAEKIRRIAHLDMDAFYASVELLRYPQLKGLPVVIGGGRRRQDDALLTEFAEVGLDQIPVSAFPRIDGYEGRGVITTATYAARQFGVGSAMGLMKAAKLCPQAILLPVDFAEYRRYSQQFKSIITEIAPVMENRGVDEVYIDFTDVPGGQREGGRVLARLIQKSIFEITGLTCSVGVAPNKLLAKMASEFNKPNGISIVMPKDLESKIWLLSCRKINGIGPKAEEKLKAHGIETIGQLAQCELVWLQEHFGRKYGAWLHAASWGRDDSPVLTHSEPVSMSRETTFERDLHVKVDREELGKVLTQLSQQVCEDLKRKGYLGRTIGIKLRYPDFKILTRDLSLAEPVDDWRLVRQAAAKAAARAPWQERGRQRIRLLGVRVGALVSRAEYEQADEGGEELSKLAPKVAISAAKAQAEPDLFDGL